MGGGVATEVALDLNTSITHISVITIYTIYGTLLRT